MVVVVVDVVVVEVEAGGFGYVAMREPSPIDISVREPVFAAGV